MSAKDYPPVLGSGARQAAWALLHDKVIFKDEWNKLTALSCRVELLPDSPRVMNFICFCRDIDTKCERRECKTPERMEMEALYTQYLVRWFDKEESADDVRRDLLKKCMMSRLDEDAETYWLKKQGLLGLPNSSIARLDEEAGEPEREWNIDFNDHNRMEVEYGVGRPRNQARVSTKDKAQNVKGRHRTKTLKTVKPAKKESKRRRRKARRAILMAKMEAITSASMVAMRKSLKALKVPSGATKAERKAVREQKSTLMMQIRVEVEREAEKAVHANTEQVTAEQFTVAQVAATRHEPIPSQPMNGIGMRTLAFRPK